jgi:hypothetical protein
MATKKKSFLFENGINLLLFSFVALGIIAELMSYNLILFVFRPSVTILIMYLYWYTSSERSFLFFLTLFFLLITSIFILSESSLFLILGYTSVTVHRIVLILYCIKLNKVKDFIPIGIGIIPFIFIFSYLLSISDEIQEIIYYPLVIQNILVSILAGVILSIHFMNEKNVTPWLSIFGVLYIALYFTVFIEKCFLSTLPPTYFRPLGMVLYATSYYAFYKFVIDNERSNAMLIASSA